MARFACSILPSTDRLQVGDEWTTDGAAPEPAADTLCTGLELLAATRDLLTELNVQTQLLQHLVHATIADRSRVRLGTK